MVRAAWELDDHDGAGLAGGAGGGQLGVGVGRLVVAGRIEHHGEADALSQHGGAEVALADVREHPRAEVDAVQDGAGAPEGDFVGGRAGDEIVVSLLQFLAGDGFIFKDVYRLVGHFAASWPLLLAARAVYGGGSSGVKWGEAWLYVSIQSQLLYDHPCYSGEVVRLLDEGIGVGSPVHLRQRQKFLYEYINKDKAVIHYIQLVQSQVPDSLPGFLAGVCCKAGPRGLSPPWQHRNQNIVQDAPQLLRRPGQRTRNRAICPSCFLRCNAGN